MTHMGTAGDATSSPCSTNELCANITDNGGNADLLVFALGDVYIFDTGFLCALESVRGSTYLFN